MTRLITLLVVLAARPALSQGFEAELRGGYTTAGGLTAGALGIDGPAALGRLHLGGQRRLFLLPPLRRRGLLGPPGQRPRGRNAAGSAELFDVRVDQLQGSFAFQLGDEGSRVRPFLTAGAGAAFFSAPDLESETKLSLGLGAGLKWLPASRVGARLQARYTPTYLDDTSSEFCDPFGFCQGWLHQFELSGGVVIRF